MFRFQWHGLIFEYICMHGASMFVVEFECKKGAKNHHAVVSKCQSRSKSFVIWNLKPTRPHSRALTALDKTKFPPMSLTRARFSHPGLYPGPVSPSWRHSAPTHHAPRWWGWPNPSPGGTCTPGTRRARTAPRTADRTSSSECRQGPCLGWRNTHHFAPTAKDQQRKIQKNGMR